jgi:carboxyl-terminal processing protease
VLTSAGEHDASPPPHVHHPHPWAKYLLVVATFPIAFYLGAVFAVHGQIQYNPVLSAAVFSQPIKGLDVGTLQQIWASVQQHYVRPNPSPDAALDAASKGLVSGVGAQFKDRNSYYETPAEVARRKEFLNGAFGGIGATMSNDATPATVAAILPNTPAQRAGLKPGDVLTTVDGVDVTKLPVNDVVNKVRGEPNTHVKITVRRGTQSLNFDIVRAEIPVPSVRSTDIAKGVLYVRIYGFETRTPQDFEDALNQGIKRGDQKIVLDLRGNPGGYVSSADAVTSEFVKEGNNVTIIGRDGHKEEHPVSGKGVAFTQKLVVLIDQDSASASEIVAGALKDYHRAVLVGQKSYGKGSVQEDFAVRRGNLHLTIAFWYTPSGASIEPNGITPDVSVALASPQSFYEVESPTADPTKDAQLQAALAQLR